MSRHKRVIGVPSGPTSQHWAHRDLVVAPPGTNSFTDSGGPILSPLQVQLIYWGSAWASATAPSASEVTNACTAIVTGPYMDGLAQYRVGRGNIIGTTMVTDSDPPSSVVLNTIVTLVTQEIDRFTVPDPNNTPNLLYCVMLPAGVSSPGALGAHSIFQYNGPREMADELQAMQQQSGPPDMYDTQFVATGIFDVPVCFAFITQNAFATPQPIVGRLPSLGPPPLATPLTALQTITSTFSHEIAEAATDPMGTTLQGVSPLCSGPGWCEIGDACAGRFGLSLGVAVQAYWSQRDQACIVPAMFTIGTVAAAARMNGQLDVFVVGADLVMYATWWNSAGWGRWYAISDPASHPFVVGFVPAVVSRFPAHLDLFVVGVDGKVWTNSYDDAPGWASWYPIGALGDPLLDSFPLQNVTACAPDESRLVVCAFGKMGPAYYTIWRDAAAAWSLWMPIPAVAGVAYRATALTVLVRGNRLVVLMVNGFGEVLSNDADITDTTAASLTWSGWQVVGTGGLPATLPGSPIGAVARDPERLDIFLVGFGGSIQTSSWNQVAQQWGSWVPVASVVGSPFGLVLPISRAPAQIDLFVAGADGHVYQTTWNDGAASWPDWWQVSDGMAFQAGGVVPVSQNSAHLDLFAIGTDFTVRSTWWDDSAPGWASWFCVY